MRISHGKLEEIRRHPGTLRVGGTVQFYSFGYARALQFAVYRLHDAGLDEGIAHLETLYRRHFKRPERLGSLISQLKGYDAAFQAQGNIVLQKNARLEEAIEPDAYLVGEIARIDLVPGSGGYAIWLLGQTRYDWRSELRMPLLQEWLASRLGASPSDVMVGFYFFDTGTYESQSYGSSERTAAQEELRQLLAQR
jgi:hypothetical protein